MVGSDEDLDTRIYLSLRWEKKNPMCVPRDCWHTAQHAALDSPLCEVSGAGEMSPALQAGQGLLQRVQHFAWYLQLLLQYQS